MAPSVSYNLAQTRRPANPGTKRARILLAMIVALNLTSICQGHGTGSHRLSLHLAIFGETGSHATPVSYTRPHSDPDRGLMYTLGSPGTSGTADVASLGAALPLLGMLGFRSSRRRPRTANEHPPSTAAVAPEPPPPRRA
jgi:hypothetical protein